MALSHGYRVVSFEKSDCFLRGPSSNNQFLVLRSEARTTLLNIELPVSLEHRTTRSILASSRQLGPLCRHAQARHRNSDKTLSAVLGPPPRFPRRRSSPPGGAARTTRLSRDSLPEQGRLSSGCQVRRPRRPHAAQTPSTPAGLGGGSPAAPGGARPPGSRDPASAARIVRMTVRNYTAMLNSITNRSAVTVGHSEEAK